MRLIDAEPLVAISWKAHKDETYERGFEDGVCHALDRIEQAPTVDAIPVEWLLNLGAIAKMELDDKMFIDWLIQTWQEEQEGWGCD